MFTALLTKAKFLGTLGILGSSVALTAPAGARMLHDRVFAPAANCAPAKLCAPLPALRGHDFDRGDRFHRVDHRGHDGWNRRTDHQR